jgi:hypothetical protein
MNVHLPAPTVWPATLATGVTFVALGLVTSPLLLVFGAILSLVALVGWVSILLREGHGP